MCGGFILSGLAQHRVARGAGWQRCSRRAQLLCFLSKARFEGLGLFDAASHLHGAAPFHERKAGALPAFSLPIKATIRSVMVLNVSSTEGLHQLRD
ncbi:hypothetical protein XH99_01105 [Bradyrhizobium nanningense]|uniref:Uncharacterized protein n=1 Tax=Bradyrhizobium nanningense TaxID=1325118 RepID=A0A4Q0SGL6_9BRAD|nr:hypothetical protein XH84_07065 [Bradyrhizobium nanningense]RXH38387.1 hypothetical protein XH99_01105 [Bradyrhizobium nanningense]